MNNDIFKPNVTVACIVEAQGYLLVVEEQINGIAMLNQPAGHLESGESLPEAASRELYEESGIRADMQHFLGAQQWKAPDNTPFLRFLFELSLPACLPTDPQDEEITCCWWLPPEKIIQADNLRSPLVAESVRIWQRGQRWPLSLLTRFGTL